MKRQDRRTRQSLLGMESLEGRAVPSTAGAHVPGRGISYLDVQGSAQGPISQVVGNPDVGTTTMLHGRGEVLGLGSVKVSGELHGTGFFASSHVEGPLTISTGTGSMTLQLQGPLVGGFTAPKSGTYQFTIQKATGSLAHDIGSGAVEVALGSTSFKLTFDGKPNMD
jgi:hypothetical protein